MMEFWTIFQMLSIPILSIFDVSAHVPSFSMISPTHFYHIHGQAYEKIAGLLVGQENESSHFFDYENSYLPYTHAYNNINLDKPYLAYTVSKAMSFFNKRFWWSLLYIPFIYGKIGDGGSYRFANVSKQ